MSRYSQEVRGGCDMPAQYGTIGVTDRTFRCANAPQEADLIIDCGSEVGEVVSRM